jgi:glycosyltransferase involved in cell wall biosynthesis
VAKIIHVITRLDRGGSAENTLLSCSGLADAYDLTLVHGLSRESRMTTWEKQSVDHRIEGIRRKGVKVMPLPSLVRKIDPIRDLCAMFALRRLFMKEKPDIVHTHTSKAGLLGRWAAKLAGVPNIVHTPHGHVFYGHFGVFASRVFLVLEKITDSITDCLIALTAAEKNDYLHFSVSPETKLSTIHSGVDIERYMNPGINVRKKKTALGLDPGDLVVGTVGWLLPIKGPMHLLNAMFRVWTAYPGAKLLFVGKGDLEQDLRKTADRHKVSENVIFLGWRDDIHEIMPVFDVFVLPSLNEGMGRVLVEAMAAERPVVASRVGGILDLVKQDHNGFLVAPGDTEGLSLAINHLLGDKRLRAEMGRCGVAVAQDFSAERMVQKIDALYRSLLNSVHP